MPSPLVRCKGLGTRNLLRAREIHSEGIELISRRFAPLDQGSKLIGTEYPARLSPQPEQRIQLGVCGGDAVAETR